MKKVDYDEYNEINSGDIGDTPMAIPHVNESILNKLERLSDLTGKSIDEILDESLYLYEEQLSAPPPPANSDFLEMIADNVLDLVVLHEPNGKSVYSSPSVTSILGFTPEEYMGRDPYDFFHPDDIEGIIESHTASLEGNQVNSVIYRHLRKDGQYIWLDTLTTPVFNEQGEVVNLVTISRDITARVETERALAEERDLFKTLMETSPSGITVVDKSGKIIYSNRRAEEITRMTGDEKSTDRTYNAEEWKSTDYDGGPWHDEQQPFSRVMTTKEAVWDVRHAIESPCGERVYLSVNGAPIFDKEGEIDKVIFTIEDYTERKHQQDAIEEALLREKHLSMLKSNFISMVSHEFRTPLSVIMTSTDILRRRHQTMTDEQMEGRLDKIVQQIRHLSDMLGEITFINKDQLMGYRAQASAVNMQDLIEQIVDEVQSAFPAHYPIEIKMSLAASNIIIDESLVQKIVTNLLTNAMKYSPHKSMVKIQCYADADTLEIMVKDKGIGIPFDDQPDLFNEFHRAGNVGTISGTGLGLAIVRRSVNALGGEVSLESAENQGTTFIVRLPITMAAITKA